jgi:hypothetical protein
MLAVFAALASMVIFWIVLNNGTAAADYGEPQRVVT